MASLTIYKDNYLDSTVVSNRFIDEYMKDANDAQLKVYLYLIRIMNANIATSISDIADKFNHTEKDIIRSLKYWEKKNTLTLDFDSDKNLIGIHLLDLSIHESNPVQDSSPVLSICRTTSPEKDSSTDSVRIGSSSEEHLPKDHFNAMLPAVTLPQEEVLEIQPLQRFSKPIYSLDQLKQFKEKETTAELLFIVQTYLGKQLTPNDIKTLLFLSDTLHFSNDLIDYLIQYCVERDKREFRYIEKVAINWAEEGITTPKQAQKQTTKYDKSVYAIMNELGRTTSPTTKEMEYIIRWMKEYDFSTDIIFEACERTVLATEKHRFEYAEGILNKWKQENVHHKSDIFRVDESFKKQRNNAKPVTSASANNRFNQFKQNSYDFTELEKELLSN